MCRWIADGVVLDVMPTEEQILGFGNEWYWLALETAIEIVLPSGANPESDGSLLSRDQARGIRDENAQAQVRNAFG